MNLQTIQTITLDFTVPQLKNIRCVENDLNSRTVKISVTNNGSPFPLNRETMTACYKIHKPDHNYIYNEVPIDENGTVTIHLTDQAMAKAGIARCELQILTKDKHTVLSTMPFSVIVEKSVVTDKDIVSSSESDVLLGMMQHMADYNNPHQTTKEHVGLGNADNTSDLDKPVSNAARRELDKLNSELDKKADKSSLHKVAVSGSYDDLSDKPQIPFFGVCDTAQGAAAKTVSCPDFTLNDGARILILFQQGNTSSYMTLNINNTGAYFAWFQIGLSRAYNDKAISELIAPGCLYEFTYQSGSTPKWVYCGQIPVTGIRGEKESSYRHGNVTLTPGDIGSVAKSGDTMTGNLIFSDPQTDFRGIRGICGSNDFWQVAGSSFGIDSGFLEIATGDNGTEPIYVRQYGVYENGISNLTRTLSLLDENGNTSVPGELTVPAINNIRIVNCADGWDIPTLMAFAKDQGHRILFTADQNSPLSPDGGQIFGRGQLDNLLAISSTGRIYRTQSQSDGTYTWVRLSNSISDVTNAAEHANTSQYLKTFDAAGTTHGNAWLLKCQYNLFGDEMFSLRCGDGSIGVRVDYATKAAQDGNGRVIANTYLPLSGGTLSGNLYFDNGGAGSGIRKGGNDTYGLSKYNNLDLYSWYGISFSTTISGSPCSGKPAVSIDTRSGNMYVYDTLSAGNLKLRKGTSNYGSKLNFGDGDYVYLYEFADDKLEICASNLYLRSSSGDIFVGKNADKGTANNVSVLLSTQNQHQHNIIVGQKKFIGLTDGSESPNTHPNINVDNTILSGYSGYIFGDQIDGGFIDYVAVGADPTHGFASYSYNGTWRGTANIYNGIVNCKEVITTGGDYAEYWEWEDKNPSEEDRVGHFVTFRKGKIVFSQKGDHLSKVGVISGAPSVIGDSDNREWRGKYERDIFGRIIYEEIVCENGQRDKQMKQNPAWDETKEYIRRSERPEWDAVGTHGKLVVIDDGTCEEDSFCIPTDGGIATAAEDGFYVSERLDKNHIRIYMK